MTVEDRYLAQLAQSKVPEHLHSGLAMYLAYGLMPGHFLTAVLENNLLQAFNRADDESKRGLEALVRFLYNDAPGASWGSREVVQRWCKERRAERAR